MQARLTETAAASLAGDAVVVPIFEGERQLAPEALALDRKSGGTIASLLTSRRFAGRYLEQVYLPNPVRAASRWTLVLGLGRARDFDLVRLRNALQFAARYLRRHGNRRIAVAVPGSLRARYDSADLARAVTEGIALGNFGMGSLKSRPDQLDGQLTILTIAGLDGGRESRSAIATGLLLAEATNRARDWVNLPANTFTPSAFVEKTRQLARETGLELKVLEVLDMRRLKMGALLAVARGSDEPAKVIVLRHRGRRKGGPMLGLVGKGITFDSGGLSLKVPDGMERMKSDMGGGAAVVSAMGAIARRGPAIHVIGVVPTTENMPSGKATRPGDVVTASSGKSIEIVNTDAEGRLIMADALTYAIGQGATHLVDVATLTGSIARALGPVATGAFSNDPGLMALVRKAADLAGERVWEMPIWPDYDGLITSEIADIKNSAVSWAGATMAALFLREFVDGRPWVHLDIAGSSWNNARELTAIPRGPTGAGVRLLAHLAGLLAEQARASA